MQCTKLFPQNNITDLISGITFIVLFSQEKTERKHTHKHTHPPTHPHTHTHTHTHTWTIIWSGFVRVVGWTRSCIHKVVAPAKPLTNTWQFPLWLGSLYPFICFTILSPNPKILFSPSYVIGLLPAVVFVAGAFFDKRVNCWDVLAFLIPLTFSRKVLLSLLPQVSFNCFVFSTWWFSLLPWSRDFHFQLPIVL